MPSSRCQQISLVMGELLNDIKMLASIPPQNNKLMLKQLSEYARQLDGIVDEAEKNAYQFGIDSVTKVTNITKITDKIEDIER